MPDKTPGPGVAAAIRDRLVDAVRERGRVATADLSGDWWEMVITCCQRDLRVITRHPPCSAFGHHFHGNSPTGSACHRCGESWPCPEIRDVAGIHGVEVPDA